jgi:hypothetical protein
MRDPACCDTRAGGLFRGKTAILITMCLGVFLAQLDSTVVYLGLKHIGDDQRAGVSQLQWVLDSYNLVYATLLLTGGALGDLYGRLRVFACGIAYSRLADLRVRPERCHADRRSRRHRSRLGFGSPDIACHPHRDLS